MIAAVLIAAMSIGFTSCSKDEKEPEPDLSSKIMGKWYQREVTEEGLVLERVAVEFKTDNTYSYLTENGTVNGMYKISESGKASFNTVSFINGFGDESISIPYEEIILVKILASGRNDYDKMWVHVCTFKYPVSGNDNRIREELGTSLVIHFYSGNQLVKLSRLFFKNLLFDV